MLDEVKEHLEGCLCEYIRKDYRERLERVITANGGGEPGTDVCFANVILQVNKALENYLGILEGATPKRKVPRKGKLSGKGV